MFAERLRELRKDKNLTQKELAKLLPLSKNSICEYEKGRSEPNIETLIKLADIFDCSIDYLVGRSDELGVVKSVRESDSGESYLTLQYRKSSPEAKEFLLKTAEFISTKK